MNERAALYEAAKLAKATTTNRLAAYRPYPKQGQFHALGKQHRQRAFLAGNRCGKTRCGAMETAYHLTGRYPLDWQGRVFPGPVVAWFANEKLETVRDVNQAELFGKGSQGSFGTGALPKDAIQQVTMSRGLPNLIDWAEIQHVSGGKSILKSKAYNEGRMPWQGANLDFIWYDEEPPLEIYSEGWIRLATRSGMCFLTATPLLGMTEVVEMFYPVPTTAGRALVQMSLDEAEHFSQSQRQEMLENLPDYEREARANGTPMLGAGRVFPIAEAEIIEPDFDVPAHWKQIAGIDFGAGNHPTGAALLAIEPDDARIHVIRDHRAKEPMPVLHASALKQWGRVPFAWPHDGGRIGDVQDMLPFSGLYRKEGLLMLPEHATFPEGGFGVNAGLDQMLQLMKTGRWKVFASCAYWFEEFRHYHRKLGQRGEGLVIVKVKDDVLSASRYAFMARRFARPLRAEGAEERFPVQVEGLHSDLFARRAPA